MTTSASVRARLTNIARKEQIPFQQIIFRYLHERLLFRISISEYADNLFLKGGNLLYATQGNTVRPTKDIDFLGMEIKNSADLIIAMFIDICNISYTNDFVWFDVDSIRAEKITKEHKFNGIRLYVNSGFDTIKQKIQIDIGFGDIMVPAAQQLDFPTLLSEMSTPVLSAYSTETVIAEKFQAMIELSELNSRMKDFYDIYTIIKSDNYKISVLIEAIKSTFKNRNTSFVENHIVFTESFVTNEDRNKMWKAFLKKINTNTDLQFAEVMQTIKKILNPVWEKIN